MYNLRDLDVLVQALGYPWRFFCPKPGWEENPLGRNGQYMLSEVNFFFFFFTFSGEVTPEENKV